MQTPTISLVRTGRGGPPFPAGPGPRILTGQDPRPSTYASRNSAALLTDLAGHLNADPTRAAHSSVGPVLRELSWRFGPAALEPLQLSGITAQALADVRRRMATERPAPVPLGRRPYATSVESYFLDAVRATTARHAERLARRRPTAWPYRRSLDGITDALTAAMSRPASRLDTLWAVATVLPVLAVRPDHEPARTLLRRVSRPLGASVASALEARLDRAAPVGADAAVDTAVGLFSSLLPEYTPPRRLTREEAREAHPSNPRRHRPTLTLVAPPGDATSA